MENQEINKRLAEIEGHTGISIYHDVEWNPAEDWSQGGRLIEKYTVAINPVYSMLTGKQMGWIGGAEEFTELEALQEHDVEGTPLKAAMVAIIKAHQKD